MGEIKIMGFHQPPLPFSLMTPIPKRHPLISPRIKRCVKDVENDYLEAFGAVYWAKKDVSKNLRGLQQPPFRRTRFTKTHLPRRINNMRH